MRLDLVSRVAERVSCTQGEEDTSVPDRNSSHPLQPWIREIFEKQNCTKHWNAYVILQSVHSDRNPAIRRRWINNTSDRQQILKAVLNGVVSFRVLVLPRKKECISLQFIPCNRLFTIPIISFIVSSLCYD